jgi:hypothetical protein
MRHETDDLVELVREFLRDFLPEFLLLVAPRQAHRLKLEHGALLSGEGLFGDLAEGEVVQADVIYQTVTLEGAPVVVLVHLEPEGPDPGFDRRMARAGLSVLLQHDVFVLPVAVFLQGGGKPGQREIYPRDVKLDAAGFQSVRYRYLAVALSRGKAESYLRRKDPAAAALAALMPYSAGNRAEHKLQCLEKIVAARELNPHRRGQLIQLVHQVLPLDGSEAEAFEVLLTEELRAELRRLDTDSE